VHEPELVNKLMPGALEVWRLRLGPI